MSDLFDVVCDLDRCMDALKALGYWDEADALQAVSEALTGSVVLRVVDPPESGAPLHICTQPGFDAQIHRCLGCG